MKRDFLWCVRLILVKKSRYDIVLFRITMNSEEIISSSCVCVCVHAGRPMRLRRIFVYHARIFTTNLMLGQLLGTVFNFLTLWLPDNRPILVWFVFSRTGLYTFCTAGMTSLIGGDLEDQQRYKQLAEKLSSIHTQSWVSRSLLYGTVSKIGRKSVMLPQVPSRIEWDEEKKILYGTV